MFNRVIKTAAAAIVSAAVLTVGTLPASAHSAAWCRAHLSPDGRADFDPVWILPLAAVGAGAGALAGVAVSGLSVTTGAAIGAGAGAGTGVLKGATRSDRDYAEAYEECTRRH